MGLFKNYGVTTFGFIKVFNFTELAVGDHPEVQLILKIGFKVHKFEAATPSLKPVQTIFCLTINENL